jgi:hypothetical protein
VEIDHSRSGKASVLSNNPFVGLQTACHARLLDSPWANIFLTRFNFESAAVSVLYEPHKIAMSVAFAQATPRFGGISAVGRHYSAFRKGQSESPRIHTLSRSSSGQAFTDRGALPTNGPAS